LQTTLTNSSTEPNQTYVQINERSRLRAVLKGRNSEQGLDDRLQDNEVWAVQPGVLVFETQTMILTFLNHCCEHLASATLLKSIGKASEDGNAKQREETDIEENSLASDITLLSLHHYGSAGVPDLG
jgi:hypothetical protein